MTGTDDVPALLAEIHEGLADDGVWVDPALAATVSDDQLREIAAQIEANPVATYVVLYPYDDADAFAGNPQDLLARLHTAHPEDGQYYTTSQYYQYGTDDGVTLAGRAYGVPTERDGEIYNDALGVVQAEAPATLGEAAERLTALLLEDPAEVAELYEETRADDPTSGGAADEGPAVGPTGLVVALVAAAVVGAVGWAALRRRRPRRDPSPVFTLPPSALDRIREAHDRRLEQQARDELLALGEAVDATDIGPGHDRDAWQAALDHYDAARRALELGDDPDDPDVLDVVGALVLARRGRDALAAAVAGRSWTPTASCFLHPLHGPATGSERLAPDDAAALPERVPLCSRCRADLAARRTPDVLDVAHDGRPRHYFETGVEPWAATGYGSLEPDLVPALQRTRR